MAEKLRLDKLLGNMGMGTRKEVKQMIKAGMVKVNGSVEKKAERLIYPAQDEVLLNNQPVCYEKYIYLMMNKPAGYVSANEDKRDPVVMELLEEPYSNMELFVAGRLDKDTEGLLILTNNGKFAHNMLAPKKHVPKTYYAKIEGRVTEEDKVIFAEGVTLEDGYQCMPAELSILVSDEESEIQLIIHEGKFHQVKRMFEAVGKHVTYLQRVQIGALELDRSLEEGAVKILSAEELALIGADLGI